MYSFVTHTWNTIKGKCPHNCSYCYMKRWGKQTNLHFDESELKTNLGQNNFIFVGSSCDIFANDIPELWLRKTLKHCEHFNNLYLFQTKNPSRFLDFIDASVISDKSVICTTLESNRNYTNIYNNSPSILKRVSAISEISNVIKTYITIEPILDFDLDDFINLTKQCNPIQVNIGADSGNNNLPEPNNNKILNLISELEKFTLVVKKKNLKRLLNNGP
ncbi:MAG: DUF5131 family protein [Ignavibacteriales bacterium]|nr:DUF5131 family protein [Ignavibacteriales bacterium]